MDLQSNAQSKKKEATQYRAKENQRECPECGFTTIYGMPGGKDATCTNCGYKDPCCYD